MASGEETTHPLSTPHRIKDLLDYQSGSVVSRTLDKKATGTLTLFAFDQGEGLSEGNILVVDPQIVAVDVEA